MRVWFPGKNFIFQQDGTPCHTGKITIKWFGDNKSEVLKWPGNFPDLNLIENLCEILKHEIHSEPITTKIELIEKLIRVWIHSEKIGRLCKTFVESMPNWIKALKASKGG